MAKKSRKQRKAQPEPVVIRKYVAEAEQSKDQRKKLKRRAILAALVAVILLALGSWIF